MRVAMAILSLAIMAAPAHADVVINEIFYHAPNDLDDLEFIEQNPQSARTREIYLRVIDEIINAEKQIKDFKII